MSKRSLFVVMWLAAGCDRREPGVTQVQVGPNGVVVRGPEGPIVRADPSGVQVQNPGTRQSGTHVSVGGIEVNAPTRPGQPASNGHSPIVCDGSQVITLTGVTISEGMVPAVSATGSCVLRLSDCTLNSDSITVSASGSARVYLTRCTITGALQALFASGSGAIHHSACTIRGTVSHSGGGTITAE